MNKIIQLQDLGNKDYKDTWEYQEELFKKVVDLKTPIAWIYNPCPQYKSIFY